MGTKNLSEILSERESISHVMQAALDEATDPWGVKVGCLMFLLGLDQPEQVERVEVKDVRLPVQLQRAMAAEAEAAREARAKVIAAEGEQKASRALRHAAEIITDCPSAIQVSLTSTLKLRRISVVAAAVPADAEQHFIGEQLHHRVSGPDGHRQPLPWPEGGHLQHWQP